jgi:acyl carrier protein
MSAPSLDSLQFIRSAIGKYCFCDVPLDQITPESQLADLNVDSLSLAEMVFAMEDRLGQPLVDVTQRPQTVADLMRLVEPYLQALTSGPAAA